MPSGLSIVAFLCVASGLWIEANAARCAGEGCNPTCPAGWSLYGCHCFIYQATAKSWGDAETSCIALGGNLASLHSREELTFATDLIRKATGSNTRIWVGGHDSIKEGKFMWSDGTLFDFTYWGHGEPNNGGGTEDCMELNWLDAPNDHQCYHKKPYMCSKPL